MRRKSTLLLRQATPTLSPRPVSNLVAHTLLPPTHQLQASAATEATVEETAARAEAAEAESREKEIAAEALTPEGVAQAVVDEVIDEVVRRSSEVRGLMRESAGF